MYVQRVIMHLIPSVCECVCVCNQNLPFTCAHLLVKNVFVKRVHLLAHPLYMSPELYLSVGIIYGH